MNADVLSVSSLTDLRSIYDAIEKDEQTIKNDLTNLYDRKLFLEKDMENLEGAIPNLEMVQSNSVSLCQMVLQAAELADTVSEKVRQLDLAKNRVEKSINRSEDILDLKACTEGSQKALEDRDYETAASYVKRYLSMDETVCAEASLRIMQNVTDQLKTIAVDKFEEATKQDDIKNIDRFLRIFPQIGQCRLGVQKFGGYLASKINKEMSSQIKLADVSDPQRHGFKYVDLMTTLLECVAGAINKNHNSFDPKLFSPGYMFSFLTCIQKECDTWSLTILDKFKKERQLSDLLIRILPNNTEHFKPDPYEIESVIWEIVWINARVELYIRFIKRTLHKDLEAVPDKVSTEVSDDCNRFFDKMNLVGEMQSLVNNYIALEEYFMRELIVKATNSTDLEDNSKVSKIAESVFFLVNKSLKRTLSGENIEGICAMMNFAGVILLEEYATQFLGQKIRQYGASISSGSSWMREAAYNLMTPTVVAGSSASSMTAGTGSIVHSATSGLGVTGGSSTSLSVASAGSSVGGSATTQGTLNRLHRFLVYVNSAEISIEYALMLQTGLQKEFQCRFHKMDSTALNKLDECLNSMTTSITDKFQEIVESGLQDLALSVLKPQIKTRISDLASMKFILSEEEYIVYEANDPWIEKFLSSLKVILDDYHETTVEGVYEKVIQKLCEEIMYRIEKIVREKSFNRLGAIQFDRDVRTLINFFSNASVWGVREKFTRLRQIATIINIENVSEITSYWNRSTWKLSPKEVKECLALRSDFRTDEIRKLSLY